MHPQRRLALTASLVLLTGCSADDGGRVDLVGGGSTGGQRNAVCEASGASGPVQTPLFVTNLDGQTGWFAAPIVADLDGDGANELIAAYYDVYVFSSEGQRLDVADDGEGRVYAPHVVVDLEGDGITEVVAGRGHQVWAWEWREGALRVKAGFPASTTSGGQAPEIRGMAAADLDGDGNIEIAVTTTQTTPTDEGGAQVFVFDALGQLYQPRGAHSPAWPRYNALAGPGNDADRNAQGHSGYGCYGLNIGIGELDDDPQLELVVTYDNHHIQVFDHDGVAHNTSPWFTNRASEYSGDRLTWGQFIRWADPAVEAAHYHDHDGEWPHPSWAEWLQWTASPPNVVDLDGDGHNEVLGVPNVEMHEPYETQAYALMALVGSQDGGAHAAERLAGWEALPRGERPVAVDGWYPPAGVPAPVTVDLQGDERPEVVVSLNDGFLYAFDAAGQRLWRQNIRHGQVIAFASEPTIADLNGDGSPEVLVATFGDPDADDAGWLMVFAADGELLHDVPLPDAGHNGNGNGSPSAPTVGDLDGDGQLEVFVQTFDHGLDVFTVPGSSGSCLLWPTARGGPLRMGQPNQL